MALLLIAVFSSCKKDKLISDFSNTDSSVESYSNWNHLSIEAAKSYFLNKKNENTSKDTTDSGSIVAIVQNLELEWNLAGIIRYQNTTPEVVALEEETLLILTHLYLYKNGHSGGFFFLKNTMKKYYLIAVFILAIATLLFIPGIQARLGITVAIHSYTYQSTDKGFRALECPEKGAT